MNIKDLAVKLKQNNININLNEDSLNYPVLKFRIRDYEIKFFYRENFIKRTKFHKSYCTFFEIAVKDTSKISGIKKNVEEILSSKYCIVKNKIYSNISKISEDEIIDFIQKF